MNQKHKELIEAYIKAYNNFDVNEMLANLHQDVVFQNISGGEINLQTAGIDEFKTQANSAITYFSERRQTITNWTFTNNTVRIEIGYSATVAQDLPNGLKTGDVLELSGASEFSFQNGKIIKIIDES